MILIPAIDIKDGQVVRLFQGQFDRVTEYSNDPLEMAQYWKSQGAQWLHIVDLDGARTGKMENIDVIKKIAKEIGIPVQVGGGVRSEVVAKDLLKSGVARVILGTIAVELEELITKSLIILQILGEYGSEQVAVSLDCLNGYVTQRGWTKSSGVKDMDQAKWLEDRGVKTIIYTDITKDGTLQGPNYQALDNILKSTNMGVIASGGITTIEDVRKLSLMKGIVGAITGKAIYEGKLDFKKALEVCS